MLFRLEFEVKYVNGTTATVTSRPATDIAFEREFGITVPSLFMNVPDEARTDTAAAMRWYGQLKEEYSCFLAWHSSRSPLPFDEWIETVDEVGWKLSTPVDPTRPGQPENSSALSLPPSASLPGNSHDVTTRTL